MKRALTLFFVLLAAATTAAASERCQPVTAWRTPGPDWEWVHFIDENGYRRWHLKHKPSLLVHCVLAVNSHKIILMDLYDQGGRRDKRYEWRYPLGTTCPLSCGGIAVPEKLLKKP